VENLVNALEQPFENSTEEVLLLGSLVMPGLEATMRIYKTKLPKGKLDP
jgi:hypothetical protein